jgi:hypothetical protein
MTTLLLDLSIDELTFGAVLSWMVEQRIDLPEASVLINLGFMTLQDISDGTQFDYVTRKEAEKLLASGVFVPPRTIIDHLGIVGHRVLAGDLGNLDLWSLIAARVRAAHWPNVTSIDVCTAFITAGRSPSFAAELMTVAEQTGTSVLAYGVTPDITATVFRDLSDAGIGDIHGLTAFIECGLTVSEAIALASQKIEYGAVRAAVAGGLPQEKWATLLPGIPGQWFPSADARQYATGHPPDILGIMAVPGATWEALSEIANNGWADAHRRLFEYGRAWKHDALSNISFADALAAARAGFSFEELNRWEKGLTAGTNRASWNNATMPPLTAGFDRGTERLPLVTRLRELGVRPSWLDEFRASGARSRADLITIAEAGITAKIAAQLRETHGTKINTGSRAPKRFATTRLLLAAWTEAQTGK